MHIRGCCVGSLAPPASQIEAVNGAHSVLAGLAHAVERFHWVAGGTDAGGQH
jgi:hypothetical protein